MYILIFAVSLQFCNQKKGVKRDIPLVFKTEQVKLSKHKTDSLLGLPSLENGTKGFECRIWYSDSSSQHRLVVFKRIHDIWSGDKFSMKYIYSRDGELEKLDYLVDRINDPVSINQLFSSEVGVSLTKLPDSSELPGYSTTFDGVFITIEFADDNHYKIISYQNPKYYSKYSSEAKTIVSFCTELNRLFGLQILL